MEEQPKEKLSLDEVQAALLDESAPLEPRWLERLSGLEASERSMIQNIWPQVDIERRQRVLETLETLAESNTTLDFDGLARLALNDDNPLSRIIAIRILWECEDPALVPDLLRLLVEDEDTNVRAQAAEGIGHYIYLGELEKIPRETLRLTEDSLLTVVDSEENPEVRRHALESLGYSGREAVRPHIEEAYEFGDEEWIASALVAMGRSADREWEPEVLEKLDHINSLVREEAARASGELELEMAVPPLFLLLEAEEVEVRMAAAWSLSQIGGTDVNDALESQLEVSDSDEEKSLLEDAIENLDFTEELEDLSLLDFSEDELQPPLDEETEE